MGEISGLSLQVSSGTWEVVPPTKSKGDAENIHHFKYKQNAGPEGWHLREASEGQRCDSLHRLHPKSIQSDNSALRIAPRWV